MWEHNTHISADYVGFLRQAVEEATDAPCIFFSGALGGMMTPDVKEHSFDEAEAMGRALAKAGLEALGNAKAPAERARSACRRKRSAVKLTNILYKFAFRRKLLPDGRDRQGRITSRSQPHQDRPGLVCDRPRGIAAQARPGAQGQS